MSHDIKGTIRRHPLLILLLVALIPVAAFAIMENAPKKEVIVPETQEVLDERRASGDLLPDLVPLPPQDVVVQESAGRTYLLFSTVYYNQGDGVMELRADEATAGIREDIERDVFQRIYRNDDAYRDRIVGNFLWHQEHLHYHYSDFVEYSLSTEGDESEKRTWSEKATFCLRDISRVALDLPNRSEDALYKVCWKELQGVSIGWGDTYFYDYPDQDLDITDLPTGEYRLTFNVNPLLRLEELRYDNNVASALLYIDQEAGTVETVSTIPDVLPEIEHVYPEQVFD